MLLFKKTNKVPQPLVAPPTSNKDSASANNVTLSYRTGATPAAASDDGTPRSQRSKNRINSLTGTRERIAQMIGRKWNELRAITRLQQQFAFYEFKRASNNYVVALEYL